MFDDLQNKGKDNRQDDNAGIQVGEQVKPIIKTQAPTSTNNQQSKQIKKSGAEDIFANTSRVVEQNEMAISGNDQKERPAQFQANQSTQEQNTSLSSDYSADNKIKIMLALLVFFIIFIVAVTWIRFSNSAVNDVDNNSIQNDSQEISDIDIANNKNQDSDKKIEKIDSQGGLDSDQDGLPDEQELQLGTDLNSIDTDNDGLFDGDEVLVYKTDPLNPDTDGDGFIDGTEVGGGYNPLGDGELYNLQEEINKQK